MGGKVSQVEEIIESSENQGDAQNLDSFRFNRDLNPSELDNWNRNLESEPDNLRGQVENNVQGQVYSQPSVSARGRVRRPARKILDDQFDFDP